MTHDHHHNHWNECGEVSCKWEQVVGWMVSVLNGKLAHVTEKGRRDSWAPSAERDISQASPSDHSSFTRRPLDLGVWKCGLTAHLAHRSIAHWLDGYGLSINGLDENLATNCSIVVKELGVIQKPTIKLENARLTGKMWALPWENLSSPWTLDLKLKRHKKAWRPVCSRLAQMALMWEPKIKE